MLDHVSITVADLARSAPFYDAVMAALGHPCVGREAGALRYGERSTGARDGRTYLTVREAPEPAGAVRHWALRAPDGAAVAAFHAAALAHGGRDDGAPGPRPGYHPSYVAAFVRDPDGNRLEAVCHRPAGDRFAHDLPGVTATLAEAGFVAATEEAAELLARAAGDGALLEALVARRLTGEPLAWVTGLAPFCGRWVGVDPGVYVPRWQSEPLTLRAIDRLPPDGVAVDLCTGSGAIAATLALHRPQARVLATDLDERAVACAARNGVDARHGDLFAPLPPGLEGAVDVVVSVVPYVPTAELSYLQRDTFAFESPLSYDGGADGADVLRRVVAESPRFLRPGGALLLELGGEQADALRPHLRRTGFVAVAVLADEDGDVRGVEATYRTA